MIPTIVKVDKCHKITLCILWGMNTFGRCTYIKSIMIEGIYAIQMMVGVLNQRPLDAVMRHTFATMFNNLCRGFIQQFSCFCI